MNYFRPPFRFVEPKDDSDPNGPHIVDSTGHVVAKLLWPLHPAKETKEAEQETYALGRAMAMASPVGTNAVLAMRDQFTQLVIALNQIGEYKDASAAQAMAVWLNDFEDRLDITMIEWPARTIRDFDGQLGLAQVGEQDFVEQDEDSE